MQCDYVMVTKNDINTIDAAIASIRRQSNVHRIIVVVSLASTDGTIEKTMMLYYRGVIDIFITENVGLAHARMLGIQAVTTKWFVFVDADVVLPDDWWWQMNRCLNVLIRNRSSPIGAICGHLYRNKAHRLHLLLHSRWRMTDDRLFTHNTIIQSSLVRDWKPDSRVNAWEDHLMTKHLVMKGYECWYVPCFGFHDHRGSVMRAAAWNAAGSRYIGRSGSILSQLPLILDRLMAGLKNTLRQRSLWFISYATRQMVGRIYGHFRWKKFLEAK